MTYFIALKLRLVVDQPILCGLCSNICTLDRSARAQMLLLGPQINNICPPKVMLLPY